MASSSTATRADAPAAAPPAVLVVDDEEAILFALDDYLSAMGWRVAIAATPADAEALLTAEHFAAALVDLRLAPGDGLGAGLDLIRHIRSRSPATRVVLLTAYGSPGVEEEARRLGVDALLAKPQPLPELHRRLVELVGEGGAAET